MALPPEEARVIERPLYGGVLRSVLVPADYATPILAARLADKWAELGVEIRGSIDEVARAVRVFLLSVGRQAGISAATTLSDLRRRHVDLWEAELVARQREERSDVAYCLAVYMMALLRRIEADEPGSLDGDLVERLVRETRLVHMRGTGLPELDPAERQRLEHAAATLVSSAMGSPDSSGAPAMPVMVALHVLLSLTTGEPPEVLRRLHARDITATPARHVAHARDERPTLDALARADEAKLFAVRYYKPRAHEEYEIVYGRTHTAFGWLRALIVLSQPARTTLGTDSLWVHQDSTGDPREATWQGRPYTLRWWIEHNIERTQAELDAGFLSGRRVFAQLRKSATTREALADPASYFGSRRRHSPKTFFDHYTNSPILRAEAGRILLTAVEEQFDAATRPRIVTAAEEQSIAEGDCLPGMDHDTSERVLSGELDTPVAACRDPLNGPHTDPGTCCPFAANGQCFSCPNALILARHLPAAVKLADAIHPDRAADPARSGAPAGPRPTSSSPTCSSPASPTKSSKPLAATLAP